MVRVRVTAISSGSPDIGDAPMEVPEKEMMGSASLYPNNLWLLALSKP
jgi:hypothetical protein